VLDELVSSAHHITERHANTAIEADHGRRKARLRLRRLKSIRSLPTIAAGHAFVQNLRRRRYAIATDVAIKDRVRIAFTELASCV
jgi:hypothetical protein